MTQLSKKLLHLSLTLLCFIHAPSARSVALTQDEVNDMEFQLRGVVLFRADNLIGTGISFLTRSKFSHAGALIEDFSTGAEYIIEATGSAGEVLNDRDYPYVRVTSKDEIVDGYGGSVTLRPIHYKERHEPSHRKVTKFVRESNGDMYEANIFELVLPVVKSLPGPLDDIAEKFIGLFDGSSSSSSSEDGDGLDDDGLPTIEEDKMICSALVARLLQYAGLLSKKMDYRHFDPGDLSEEHPKHTLKKGAKWGDQVTLKEMPESSSDESDESDDWRSGTSEEDEDTDNL